MNEFLSTVIGKVQRAESAFCRFITANDVGSTGGHQCGFYIPKCAASLLFETPCKKGENKDKFVEILWQDSFTTKSRFVYYGQGTRNEYRITRFGSNFPFLQEDNVGDLLILARNDSTQYVGFVLQADTDIEEFFVYFNLTSDKTNQLISLSEVVTADERLQQEISQIVAAYADFPETAKMAEHARTIYNKVNKVTDASIECNPDKILMKWFETEYCLFHGFEDKIYKSRYSQPFACSQDLISFANTILNRRKSRAGKSLEHHLATMFTASRLVFEEQVVTEENKKPDFIFPGSEAYHNLLFPTDKLVFLGAKTTCKDRWRQILNEADRIETKYLFTLQQGISKNQLREMKHEKVKLVVPASYLSSFDREYQSEIETLKSFIQFVRVKQH